MHELARRHAPLVAVERGELIESEHWGSVAVVDQGGRLGAWAGDPEMVTFMRSAAKPFQAMALLESGAAEALGLTSEELAIACASHSAEPIHVETVTRLLRRAGLDAGHLGCGPHTPLDDQASAALARRGRRPQPIHNNCSGKHAGMLVTCAYRGWPLDSYLDPAHPLQAGNLKRLAAFAGLAEGSDEPAVGVDGCGAPTFALPLRAMALAFARLADPRALDSSLASMSTRVRLAMEAYPQLVAGTGRFDTALLEQAGGRLVCKGGAEALHCVGVPALGLGIALKVSDGGSRAVPPAMLAVLRALDVLTPTDLDALSAFALPPVRNTRGEVVGRLRPLVRLSV